MKRYDYIILGAGAAGLQLAYYMAQDDFFKEKSILIIERTKKNKNDRTWCFWEAGYGDFDNIVYQIWDNALVADTSVQLQFSILPYQYKMIKGIDFYNYILGIIGMHKNITIIQDEVLSYNDNGDLVTVNTATKTYEANKVFNSLFDYKTILNQTRYPVIRQHFIGWYVQTSTPIFKKDRIKFMDFSISQKGNTRFMYVLPFSENEALLEYTLFSEELLEEEEYENAIKEYLKTLGATEYKILEKEKGDIPMTSYRFYRSNSKNLMHIGTAGGWTKASTGFTFLHTNEKIKSLISFIKKKETYTKFYKKNRFWYYDMLLLDVLYKRNDLGVFIFPTLFKKNKPQLIMKFLEERTSFSEEFKIMLSITHWEFIKAFFKRLFKPFWS